MIMNDIYNWYFYSVYYFSFLRDSEYKMNIVE